MITFLICWFLISIPMCLFIGKFIAFGTGSDQE